jgi:hypothetical protein
MLEEEEEEDLIYAGIKFKFFIESYYSIMSLIFQVITWQGEYNTCHSRIRTRILLVIKFCSEGSAADKEISIHEQAVAELFSKLSPYTFLMFSKFYNNFVIKNIIILRICLT